MKTLAVFLTLPFAASALAARPAVTIYNQDFGVVRERVSLDLRAGVNEIRFTDITSKLEPDSVILRDPAGRAQLRILEQNFRNDPVSEGLLLALNEGHEIDFLVREPQKPDRVVRGRIVRSGYTPPSGMIPRPVTPYYYVPPAPSPLQPIIEVEGKLQFQLPGLPLFPTLADDSILKPELSWRLESSEAGQVDAELCYVTSGMTWKADYNIVAPAKGEDLELTGWVTMTNESGRTFTDARVKLMAGDVNKIDPQAVVAYGAAVAGFSRKEAFPGEPPVSEKSFDEYHLYTLERPATLRNRESKQVEFARAEGIKSQRIYVYDGAMIDWNRWRGYPRDSLRQAEDFGIESNPKVWVMREFMNSMENNLGLPLPAGRMRFYQRDEDGQLEFVGENEIDHTPQNEKVRVYVGNAFDIVGERRRTAFQVDSANHWADESFEITLRNRKKEPVEVRVTEHLYRWVNWEIRDRSDEFTKLDAQKVEFRVELGPDEERKVTYLAHYSW